MVVALCALLDVVLMAAGVFGLGAVGASQPAALRPVVLDGGVWRR